MQDNLSRLDLFEGVRSACPTAYRGVQIESRLYSGTDCVRYTTRFGPKATSFISGGEKPAQFFIALGGPCTMISRPNPENNTVMASEKVINPSELMLKPKA